VIPKLKRADYTLAKNFPPISLLERLCKLLKKVVARIIYRRWTSMCSSSPQFGGQNASSSLDAGLTLLHDIQAAHETAFEWDYSCLTQGYIDNINHE